MDLLKFFPFKRMDIETFYSESNSLIKKGLYLTVALLLMISLAGNATTYYISVNGNDGNSGTSPEQAWKTLAKVNSFTPGPGDQFLFNRGGSWSGTLTAKASGTSGSPVVYGAYGTGDRPKIYGSEAITGWTLHSGKIYKAPFNAEIAQLFLNDKRATLARYPNSGYFNITSVQSSTQFTSTVLNGGINYKGASWVGRTSAFTMYSNTVNSSSSQTITLASAPMYGLGAGEGFFLSDKLEFLDQAGEWYYDKATKTVYFWTPNGDSPENYLVRGSVFGYGMNISNVNYVTVKDLSILHSSENGIYINNSDYISVENTHILSPDLIGIFITSGNSASAVLKNNYIYQANGGGIRCYSPSVVITDNTIENTGMLENINKKTYATSDNFGTGIYSRGDNPTISYNRVINSGYAGINWKGKNGIISYNLVNGACQVLDDGGGIYTYNGSDYNQPASAGSKVTNNIILNVFGNRKGYTSTYGAGSGIYMDDNTHDVEIKNNTISGCTYGIFLHKAGRINVEYNVVTDCLVGLLAGGEAENSYVYNNIVYAYARKGDVSWWKDSHQRMVKNDSASPIYDRNKYIHHYSLVDQFSNSYSFTEWKSATNQDANSTFDGTTLADGETEKLFYNDTKQAKTINLGSTVYRDIDGNQVKESLTLQPFTSKILITTKSVTSNQSPVIQGQTFNIQGDAKKSQVVGEVLASDPDPGQVLNYTITQDNAGGLFSINPSTGELFTTADLQITTDTQVDLIIKVTDNATSPLSANAVITINITGIKVAPVTDQVAPTIASFIIPQTATSQTISVTAFSATDNMAVTGYKLTETATAPLSGDNGWLSSAPTSYTFSQNGAQTLYAWVKDAAGNISSPVSATVTISPVESVEYVTICEGENYLGWTTSGTYQRTVNSESGATVVMGTNQIANSSFTGGTTGWNAWGATGYSLSLALYNTDYTSGPSSMQVKCTANGTTVNSLHLITGGNIKVEAGKEYELSFYAKSTVDFTVGRMYILKATTPWPTYGSFEVTNPKITKSWNQYKIRFTATVSGSDAQLRFYLGNSLPVGQSLYLDDVVFAEYSETTTTSEQIITTVLTVNPIQKITENVTINEGENYLGWTVAGEYQRTLTALSGCDSIVVTNLKVNPIYLTTENITITAGDSYLEWCEPGTYERILTTATGCDSIVTTILTVVPATVTSSEEISICQGDNYLGWTEAGQYERTLKAASGADSIVITNLWINPVYNITENISINEGENYLGWTASGEYQRTLVAATGCDSIITTQLSVIAIQKKDSVEYVTICEGENYLGWTTSGTYQRTVNSESGATVVMGNNQITNSSFTGGTTGWNAWGATGYSLSLALNNTDYISGPSSMQVKCTANGTTVNSLHLITGGNIKVEAGKEYELSFYAKSTVDFTVGRMYILKATTPWPTYGSFEVTNPKITKSWNQYKIRFTATVSGSDAQLRFYLGNSLPVGQSLFLDDVVFAEYSGTTTTSEQVVTTVLTVNPVQYSTESITINEGENYLGWTVSGEYQRTLVAATGCDSIITTQLSVVAIQEEDSIEHITICEGENYLGWTTSGTYQRTVNSGSGATVVMGNNQITNSSFTGGTAGWTAWGKTGYGLNLSLNTENYVSGPSGMQVKCTANGKTVNSLHLITGGNIKVEAGKEYELSFYAKSTVDFTVGRMYILKGAAPWTTYGSFEVTNPKISKSWNQYKIRFTATVSGSDAQLRFYLGNSLPVGQSLFLDDVVFAEYSETTTTSEQVVTTVLTVNPVQYSTESITINEGENYLGWTVSGEYQRTLVAATGCDSIVTTVLDVQKTIANNNAETSEGSTDTWSPDKAGNLNTSESIFDIKNFEVQNEFKMYPNPAKSYVNIDYTSIPETGTTIEIMDGNGRTVVSQQAESNLNRIDTNRLTPGMYYVRSANDNHVNVKKLIVE